MPQPATTSLPQFFLLLLAGSLWFITAAQADELDYSAADPELQVVRLDTAPTESFLAVRADTEGRLFVGGREAIYVYEPQADGTYAARRELLRFPDHTWVYDIEVLGNDLYILTVSALYVIPDGRIRREGLAVRRLVWGVPLGHVHQCFHGLTLGPEGDLYFAMGDPLWYYGDFNRPDHWGHWTMFSRPAAEQNADEKTPQPDWVKTPYTGVGAVFRCRPDGSRLQVVARGLRNSCGLAFDHHWNLFTNDNDHESMPAEYVPGRLNHVTPHAWFGWPRGWMLNKTPDRMDMLDTMITTLGRAVPVGQAYYDEAFFPQKYRDNLLVARWCTRQLTRYPLQHHGATFKTEEFPLLDGRNMARPVGVSVGRGGRIFATICYMSQNEGSPTYKSDLVMITRADDPATHPFDAYDATTATPEKLWAELSDPSWSRRYRAHQEILRRGGKLLEEALPRLEKTDHAAPVACHLAWLAGASGDPEVMRRFDPLGQKTKHAPFRLQLVRVATEFFAAKLRNVCSAFLATSLQHSDAQVRHAAVLGQSVIFDNIDLDDLNSVPPGLLDAARGEDTYLRQAAAMFLAEQPCCDILAQLCHSPDAKTRLAGVLAVGFRLTLPLATAPIPDNLSLEPWRNAEAYSIQFIDASEKVNLREFGRIGLFTVADHWKAAPHTDQHAAMFNLLAERLKDESEKVRLQAAHFLYMLNDPRTEPEIARVRTDTQKQRLSTAGLRALDKVWLAGPFPDAGQGFKTVHPPEQGPIDLEAQYPAPKGKIVWQPVTTTRQFNISMLFGNGDGTSSYAYTRLESGSRQTAMLHLGSDDGVKVWHNGREVFVNAVVRAALPTQDTVLLELQPGGNDILIRVRNVTGDSGLYLHFRSLQPLENVLPEKLGPGSFAERLKAAAADPDNAQLDPKFFTTDWTNAATQGDAARGRKLFGAMGLGCAKCHGVTPDSTVNGGPSLAEAVKRFTVPHLVESILLPGKQISPVFKATLIATNDGKIYTGLVVGETAEKVELVLSDANRVSIPKAVIEERQLQDSSPMPQGLVKTTDELRDLLAYLLSVNPAAP